MREPKPYFRHFDGWWYVQIRQGRRRVQHKLVRGAGSEEEAYAEYHRLMAACTQKIGRRSSSPAPSALAAPIRGQSVVAIVDEFLDHCQALAPRSYQWYRQFLQSFAKHIGPSLDGSELTVPHVNQWIKARNWPSSSTRNCAVRAVRRCFRWAVEEGHLAVFPLHGLKAPPKTVRERVISSQEFEAILKHSDNRFSELMRFLWQTGARPQEAYAVEARHVELALARIIFPISESKGKRRPRVIYLNEEALQIVARLVKKHPKGKLFRNARFRPWTSDAVVCRFRKLKDKLGTRYCAYHLRHSWCHHALARGLDVHTVAVLMGHSSTQMVESVYGHLAQAPVFLRDAVKRATG